MYRPIPVVELAIAASKEPGEVVMQDRLRFVPFFRAAEEYIHENEMIIGGNAATLMLLGDSLGPADFFYEIYSDNAITDARALTDLIYSIAPAGLSHYTMMTTRIPQKEFEISVDERPLFRIKALAVHRGARAVDIIVPSLRPGNFAKDKKDNPLMLQCMGPEIQLMEIYSVLADPSRAGDWGTIVGVEEKLRALFNEEIQDKIAKATSEGKIEGGNAHCKDKSKNVQALMTTLLQEYVPQDGHVLIGSFAVANLSKSHPRGTQRIQIITSNSFKDEERAILNIANRLGYNVQSTTNELWVPTDSRLQRMTMYIIQPNERRMPFLDIFNAGNYQLIGYIGIEPIVARRKPHRHGNQELGVPSTKNSLESLPVGTPFNVLRFLLVEAWTIQLLFQMRMTSVQYTQHVLREIVTDFDITAKAYLSFRDAKDFAAIFSNDYIGCFQDPIIHVKRERRHETMSKQRGRRIYNPPYYPARRGTTST